MGTKMATSTMASTVAAIWPRHEAYSVQGSGPRTDVTACANEPPSPSKWPHAHRVSCAPAASDPFGLPAPRTLMMMMPTTAAIVKYMVRWKRRRSCAK